MPNNRIKRRQTTEFDIYFFDIIEIIGKLQASLVLGDLGKKAFNVSSLRIATSKAEIYRISKTYSFEQVIFNISPL